MPSERIVVIGASAGGVEALKSIAAQLPADFPAPILVVLHVGKRPSILPEILAKAGPLGSSHARHGEVLRPGHIYVAPPDHHLIVQDGRAALSHGPKEHHARPAVDPLFRAVALNYGSAAIAVVLTGWGEDGTAGLQGIKACGGITVAQDPEEAPHKGMPFTALRYGAADRSARLAEMGELLTRLAREGKPPDRECPAYLIHEQDLFISRGDPMEHLSAIGKPSPFVCPECSGGLWEVAEANPARYRCHTGHGYTLRTLQHAQSEATDSALWSAIRGLQEESLLLREMARTSSEEGDAQEGARLEMTAAGLMQHADRLRELVESPPHDITSDSPPPRAGEDYPGVAASRARNASRPAAISPAFSDGSLSLCAICETESNASLALPRFRRRTSASFVSRARSRSVNAMSMSARQNSAPTRFASSTSARDAAINRRVVISTSGTG
jgi:two-component system chemotaxis response regulator CheB